MRLTLLLALALGDLVPDVAVVAKSHEHRSQRERCEDDDYRQRRPLLPPVLRVR